ncbi:hypothetical protein [Sorangium sp. So ce1024]|uniref:hypothetical protein n=1 Tax=Sorangium sp. So ce1024 TaxID=3133327 RepID=UPI003EFD43E0
MTDDSKPVFVVSPNTPQIELRRIKSIRTYEVMESDLDALQTAADEEQKALGFFTAAIGAAAGSLFGWPQHGEPTVMAAVVAVLSVVLTFWFGATWVLKRRSRKNVLADIRSKASTELSHTIKASSPAVRDVGALPASE